MNDQIKEERISWQNLLHLLVCSKGRLIGSYREENVRFLYLSKWVTWKKTAKY